MNDQVPPPQEHLPRSPYHDEKAEENHTTEELKHVEKSSLDTLSAVVWALILIWAGLVFLASNLGWLEQLRLSLRLPGEIEFPDFHPWSMVALGAGVLLLIEALIRVLLPAYRSNAGGNLLLAAIFLGIGLNGIFSWQLVWPLVLIALGLIVLGKALIQRQR